MILIIQEYFVFLEVSITFADAEAIRLDKCTGIRDTGISHDERQTSSTSDKGGKVAEKTVAGMLHVTHTYMLMSLYKQTTQY